MTATTDESREHVTQFVDRARLSMLTTTTDDGHQVSRPMAVQEVEFDGDLWFFTYEDSDKVRQVSARPEVNVSFSNDKQSEWTSLSGTAELVHDRSQAERLWAAPLQVWFPDGIDTEGIALLKVHVDTAEYWDSPSSRIKKLVGGVRAAASGDPDKFPGENETVEL